MEAEQASGGRSGRLDPGLISISEALQDKGKAGELESYQILEHALIYGESWPAGSPPSECVIEAYNLTLAMWKVQYGVQRPWKGKEDSQVGFLQVFLYFGTC